MCLNGCKVAVALATNGVLELQLRKVFFANPAKGESCHFRAVFGRLTGKQTILGGKALQGVTFSRI